ncbi:hypothetical protein HSBAA_51450 [Vreelandella sulfidaeris]|uniref:Uncharacterized protein n=1 Tax=Vreelandella sulfidaeris TaxID=115553 RepID=A0A455UHY8_9GAMM|nr:hypothetical protein HSBAA_51450 [Halomonas sulfidaeris]
MGACILEVAEGLANLSLGETVTWYLPPSDIVLHRRDRPSQGERENPLAATVEELVVLGALRQFPCASNMVICYVSISPPMPYGVTS